LRSHFTCLLSCKRCVSLCCRERRGVWAGVENGGTQTRAADLENRGTYTWHEVSYTWYVLSYTWYVLSYTWHVLSYTWYVLLYSWYVLSYTWHVLSYTWHVLSYTWHVIRRNILVTRGITHVTSYIFLLKRVITPH